jgi:O-antigen/teichoic acid export membrane protein
MRLTQTPAHTSPPFLREKFLRNAAWSTALRWTVKAIGLVSTACLARLLTPADFGLIAMAMIVIGFVDVWSDIGVEYALIHNQNATADSYHTAWTLRLIQAVVVATVVIASAPLAALYFKEPRVTPLLWVLAAAPLFSGLRNIGVVDFRKHLRLEKEFKLLVTSKLLTVAATLVCAWFLRSFWAMVVGVLLGSMIEAIGSYVIHPFRPRLSLKEAGAFSGYWMATLANGFGHFSEGKLDEMLVGRFGSTSAMGLYSLASDFGQMPVTEVAAPLNKMLVPTMSMLQAEPRRMCSAFLNYMNTLAFIIVPACVGLAVIAESFVRVVLGEQWLGSTLVLQILAIFAIFRSSVLAAANALVGLGRPGLSAGLAWIGVALLLVGGILMAPTLGVTGIAIARLAGGLGVVLIAFISLTRALHCRLSELLSCYLRPGASSAIMALTLLSLPHAGGAVVTLLVQITIGAIVYLGSSFLLWTLVGRPDGGERLVIEQLARIRNWR